MGNRAFSWALIDLIAEMPNARGKFKEVILAAPDMDADIFKRDIAPRIVTSIPSVTLYVSTNDKAINLSQAGHGNPRVGDASDGIGIFDGIETIDASNVETAFWGHSYYGDEPTIISDIYYLIFRRLRAEKRFGLSEIRSAIGRYWKVKKQ
jgi:esterase/lipase superfamily enzyme